MITIKKNITVNAPVEKVYNYLEDQSNQPEWIVGMIELKDSTGSNVGDSFKWKYKMAGIMLEGKTNIIEKIPNEKLVTTSEGGASSTWTFTMEPTGQATGH